MPSHSTDPFVPAPDTVIWRYMPDWKFDDLLKRYSEHASWVPERPGTRTVPFNGPGNLWFGYPSSFDDPTEARLPAISHDPERYINRMLETMGVQGDDSATLRERYLTSDNQKIREGIVAMAELCGVSCWTAENEESEDLWGVFGGVGNGVAVRSTCSQVERSLSGLSGEMRAAKPSLCAVGYVDHNTYFLPYAGYRGILAIVGMGWSYENEVRFVAKSPAFAGISMEIKRTALPDLSKLEAAFQPIAPEEVNAELARITDEAVAALRTVETSGSKGFHLPVTLKGLMSEVVVNSDAESGFDDTVKEKLKVAGLEDVPVRRSRV